MMTPSRRTAMLVLSTMLFPPVRAMAEANDPAKGPARTLVIETGMTMKRFIETNGLSIGPRIAHGFAIDADAISDWAPIAFDDHWVALEIRDGEQGFSLPPGRALHISQQAGRITGFALRPFAQPRPLDEMRAEITGLLDELQRKGWRSAGKIRVPEKPGDFDRSGKSLFAELTSASGNVLQMNLRDYGLAPRQESFILKLNPFASAPAPSGGYLLQVTVDMPNVPDYGAAIYPRRLFVNGDKAKPVPLRAWIDDPDWTPQQAGMVEASAEERAKPDSSDWIMPPEGRR